jgi:thioredoxin 1
MSTFLIVILGIVAVLIGLIAFSYFKMKNMPEVKKSDKIIVLTPKTMKTQLRSGLVLVDFWAAWCAPCKMLAPVLNDIADNENNIKVAKLDVEKFQQTAAKYKIKNLPTLVLFKNGKEVTRIIGFKNKKAIMKEIEPYM